MGQADWIEIQIQRRDIQFSIPDSWGSQQFKLVRRNWRHTSLYKMMNYIGFCESFKEQYKIISRSSNEVYTFIFLLNIIFSIMAIFGNILIIDALRRCCSLHSPSKALLFSLACSDLCVGCIAQPLFVTVSLVLGLILLEGQLWSLHSLRLQP